MKRFVISLVLFVAALPAVAQESRWQFTPMVGYADGGRMRVDDSQLTDGYVSVDIARSDLLGVKLARRLTSHPDVLIEFEFSRQETQFEDDQRLFGEQPAGPLPPGKVTALDVFLAHVHAGVVWDFAGATSPTGRRRGELQPFLSGSAGVTRIGSSAPLPSDTRPSIMGGIGTRMWLTENFALRFEARALVVHTDSDESRSVPIENRDCEGECIRVYAYPDYLAQAQVLVGFTWSFERFPYLND